MPNKSDEHFEATVRFFRVFALRDELLDDGQLEVRDGMISRNPEAWREAQRRGPLSGQEEFEMEAYSPDRHILQ